MCSNNKVLYSLFSLSCFKNKTKIVLPFQYLNERKNKIKYIKKYLFYIVNYGQDDHETVSIKAGFFNDNYFT